MTLTELIHSNRTASLAPAVESKGLRPATSIAGNALLQVNKKSRDLLSAPAVADASGAYASTDGSCADPFAQIAALSLSDGSKARLTVAASGGQGAQAAADAEAVAAALQGVNPDEYAQLLEQCAKDPSSDQFHALASVLSSPAWAQGTAEDRQNLLQLMTLANGDPQTLKTLAKLCQDPAKLKSFDSQGHTLLQDLVTLAAQPVNSAIKNTTSLQVLNSVMAECADPTGTIDQSCYGTCADTSVQFTLVTQQPAEYARLITGLSGPDGKAVMAGGGTLVLQHEYYSVDHPTDDRSPSEIMFQEAAEEYGADGGDPDANDYDAATDRRDDTDGGGLYGDETANLASQVMNEDYSDDDSGNTLATLEQLSAQGLESGVIVNLSLPGGGGHALDFAGVSDGKVYFRNPWGVAPNKKGDVVDGLVCEDPSRGIWSCTVEQYQQWATSIDVPDKNHSADGDVIGTPVKAGG